jgi:methionyl-tRNA formyltransferase
MNNIKDLKIVFFGTDTFSITSLNAMGSLGLTPKAIVTVPDKPQGRKMVLTPSLVKIWADERNVPNLTPIKLDSEFAKKLKELTADLFVVASYGKIIPQEIIDIPKYGCLNIHPSLLPKYRGATPIESAILDDEKHTGVTVMKMDALMDHGPIVHQTEIIFEEWPTKLEVEEILAWQGGIDLANILESYINNSEIIKEQNHDLATFTKKITKKDGEIKLESGEQKLENREKYLKYIAYTPWPSVYFFQEHKGKEMLVKIKEARFENDIFIIEKVIPEGKSEMSFESFKNGYM